MSRIYPTLDSTAHYVMCLSNSQLLRIMSCVSPTLNSQLRIFPITFVSSSPCPHSAVLAYISHSLLLLPWNISNTQIIPHHSYTLTLATLILPYKHHVTSHIYGNHYHTYVPEFCNNDVDYTMMIVYLCLRKIF